MTLVHLRLRQGEAIVEARQVEGGEVLYFCAKDWCPHYQGQLSLLAGAETMHCALVQYPPFRICQPFYLEVAEATDKRSREVPWEQRLAEAEAFEAAVAAAATASSSAPSAPSNPSDPLSSDSVRALAVPSFHPTAVPPLKGAPQP